MVQNLSGIVEDTTLRFGDNLLQRHGLKLRSGNEFVEVVDVGLQVLAVVILNRFLTDDRLQRIGSVRQSDERKKKCQHTCLGFEVNICLGSLPDSLDESGCHESATDESEDCAAEQPDEATPSLCLEVQFFQTRVD